MDKKILLGRGDQVLEVPEAMWKEHLAQIPLHSHDRLSFMTEAHHRVRYFVVKELLDRQKPVEPQTIADRLSLPLAKVGNILDDLERKLFFLVRDDRGAVAWAYPVTVQATPHQLTFDSGERLYGA